MKWIARHKVGFILMFLGATLWIHTGDHMFMVAAVGLFVAGLILRKMPRTLVWGALAIYATIITPNGWFLVIALAALVAIFPMLRRITPAGDIMPSRTAPARK